MMNTVLKNTNIDMIEKDKKLEILAPSLSQVRINPKI
jgi:hypothetical protein